MMFRRLRTWWLRVRGRSPTCLCCSNPLSYESNRNQTLRDRHIHCTPMGSGWGRWQ